MKNISLGIGSRVRHSQYGSGVVVQVKPEEYLITCMEHGMREIERTDETVEVIDSNDQETDLVSLADIEVLLINIFKKYTDIQERVDIGSKWTGGTLIMKPGDSSLKPKE